MFNTLEDIFELNESLDKTYNIFKPEKIPSYALEEYHFEANNRVYVMRFNRVNVNIPKVKSDLGHAGKAGKFAYPIQFGELKGTKLSKKIKGVTNIRMFLATIFKIIEMASEDPGKMINIYGLVLRMDESIIERFYGVIEKIVNMKLRGKFKLVSEFTEDYVQEEGIKAIYLVKHGYSFKTVFTKVNPALYGDNIEDADNKDDAISIPSEIPSNITYSQAVGIDAVKDDIPNQDTSQDTNVKGYNRIKAILTVASAMRALTIKSRIIRMTIFNNDYAKYDAFMEYAIKMGWLMYDENGQNTSMVTITDKAMKLTGIWINAFTRASEPIVSTSTTVDDTVIVQGSIENVDAYSEEEIKTSLDIDQNDEINKPESFTEQDYIDALNKIYDATVKEAYKKGNGKLHQLYVEISDVNVSSDMLIKLGELKLIYVDLQNYTDVRLRAAGFKKIKREWTIDIPEKPSVEDEGDSDEKFINTDTTPFDHGTTEVEAKQALMQIYSVAFKNGKINNITDLTEVKVHADEIPELSVKVINHLYFNNLIISYKGFDRFSLTMKGLSIIGKKPQLTQEIDVDAVLNAIYNKVLQTAQENENKYGYLDQVKVPLAAFYDIGLNPETSLDLIKKKYIKPYFSGQMISLSYAGFNKIGKGVETLPKGITETDVKDALNKFYEIIISIGIKNKNLFYSPSKVKISKQDVDISPHIINYLASHLYLAHDDNSLWMSDKGFSMIGKMDSFIGLIDDTPQEESFKTVYKNKYLGDFLSAYSSYLLQSKVKFLLGSHVLKWYTEIAEEAGNTNIGGVLADYLKKSLDIGYLIQENGFFKITNKGKKLIDGTLVVIDISEIEDLVLSLDGKPNLTDQEDMKSFLRVVYFAFNGEPVLIADLVDMYPRLNKYYQNYISDAKDKKYITVVNGTHIKLTITGINFIDAKGAFVKNDVTSMDKIDVAKNEYYSSNFVKNVKKNLDISKKIMSYQDYYTDGERIDVAMEKYNVIYKKGITKKINIGNSIEIDSDSSIITIKANIDNLKKSMSKEELKKHVTTIITNEYANHAYISFAISSQQFKNKEKYLNGIKQYTGANYDRINSILRGDDINVNDDDRELIKSIDEAFEEVGIYLPKNTILYRGAAILDSEIEALTNGSEINLKSYSSTSFNVATAISFSKIFSDDLYDLLSGNKDALANKSIIKYREENNKHVVIYSLDGLQRVPVLIPGKHSQHPNESEVVLPRNTLIRSVPDSMQLVSDRVIFIHATVTGIKGYGALNEDFGINTELVDFTKKYVYTMYELMKGMPAEELTTDKKEFYAKMAGKTIGELFGGSTEFIGEMVASRMMKYFR
jgi:hypothetical protein